MRNTCNLGRKDSLELKTPTPLRRLKELEKALNFRGTIWIKDDGVISHIYGGNKPRKLQSLLKKAREEGKKRLVTTGGIGTNHGLATVLLGKEMGFSTILYLYPQPVTVYVKRNLVRMKENGAEIIPVTHPTQAVLRAWRHAKRNDDVFFIPPGGSTPEANMGFFFAVFELKNQMKEAELDFDAVFVPAGTCGTLTGIATGWTNAELRGKIYGIRVVEKVVTNKLNVFVQVQQLVGLLRKKGIRENPLKVLRKVEIKSGYLGKGYGDPTQEAIYAVEIMKDKEGIELETTYTGKTLAGLLDYVENVKKGNILFWNTHNANEPQISHLDERFKEIVEETGIYWMIEK